METLNSILNITHIDIKLIIVIAFILIGVLKTGFKVIGKISKYFLIAMCMRIIVGIIFNN